MEVLDVALRSRTRRDEMLRSFRGGPYVYDIVMDVGAYRDMHRHRRCIQLRQDYGTDLGVAIPPPAIEAGVDGFLRSALEEASSAARRLPPPAADYALPFATRARFLFKMDFAEAEYICRLRSGVKGPLQLSSCCVGNEMRNGETRTGVRTFNIGNFTLGRRSPPAVNSSADAWGISL